MHYLYTLFELIRTNNKSINAGKGLGKITPEAGRNFPNTPHILEPLEVSLVHGGLRYTLISRSPFKFEETTKF